MFLEHKAVPSMIFLNRRSQEGRWQIDRSLNSAQSFPMGRLGNSMHRFLWVVWETQCIASYGSLCRAWTPIRR
ncbi:hypothetical protein [Leptospira noguchii]|uniref:hypothetical protein n=1 Tax=Leptospira noguchii TaxID=28182 RepID=UPI001FB7AFF8|nr:hypothetical protein [Leptospira noguchii]UOG32563.1 hypothetical protein MAL06_19105 [Leptospira noguchii]UOG47102.1 hypothetical protein MAL01_18105 [Leptospira noguchii]